jgi:hypothetical protein
MKLLIYAGILGLILWAGQSFSASSAGQKPVLNADELRPVRNQLKQCWNVPKQLLNADNLVIDVALTLNTDATIHDIALVDKTDRYVTDIEYRDMADSVIIALKNPHCKYLDLPANKYEYWHKLRVSFDPREMRTP